LRRLVWQPLEKHLGEARTVLLSPDGALAQLPFAALPGSKKGSYLLEERALAVVPVPQMLPALLAPVVRESRLKPSLLVVGDLDFDRTEASAASADDRSTPRGSLKGWKRLPGTQAEAAAVKDAFRWLFRGGRVTHLRESEGTKAAVRAALGKHRFVHLATHGFFAPEDLKSALAAGPARGGDPFGQRGVSGWHPLLLSGIVLAGANREARPGEEDGILTAFEVNEMDLSGCDLAVLSACETGLGQVAGGEGLLGLQRAFAVAGTRSVIASLWQVDDKATRDLMLAFYQRLWDRKKPLSRIEALRQAQLWMLRDRPRGMFRSEDKRLPPSYWAAFVLSGDWR
jgi:CHAT domain-containing protein